MQNSQHFVLAMASHNHNIVFPWYQSGN